MIFDYETLRCLWWGLLQLFLIGFAVTGGYDVGAAILLPYLGKTDDQRRVIINAMGAMWEANQVWFITAGVVLFAAWPIAYSVLFSSFYAGLLLVLFALMFRPLSFDYRSKLPNHRWRDWWDKSLFISGLIPAVMFGLVFGNLLKGIPFHLDSDMRIFYLGDFMGLLNPFALLVSVVSAAMLIMHGAVFLQVKTEGDIQVAAKVMVTRFAMIALVAFAIAGFWVMRLEGYHIKSEVVMNAVSNPLAKFVRRSDGLWLDNYEHYFALWLIPLLAFIAGGLTIWLSKKDKADLAFISSAVMLGSIILTASVSMFPFLIPSNISLNTSLTIWDASASQKTLQFLLWGTLIFLPIVLIYTQWVFKILRGKVTTEQIQQNTHSLY